MSLECIIMLQKSLFSDSLWCDSSLVFVLNERRQFKQKKKIFYVIPLNSADSFLTTRYCHFSAFQIIKIITCFSRFELCTET